MNGSWHAGPGCYTVLVLLPQLLLTLLLLVVCSFAPGFLFVRRLRWSGLEKLCGSIALSLVLLWLATWGIYVFAQPAAYFVLAALCCVAGIAVARDACRLFRGLRVRRALQGFIFLLAWTLLVVAVIRNYSGAMWSGDWLEHFQRTLFFVQHFPKNAPIFGDYLLPARPPMMNVLAAFFLGVTADRFEIFQLVFVFFNLLVFLPCCLVIRALARVRRVRVLPLVGVFAMNPAVMQNATYTWTKLLTVFFVILALSLYLSAWRKRDSLRMTAAFVALAAGLLVHYSAGPYVAFFALHYLLVLWRARPGRWKELATIAIACPLLLFTWFGWSLAAYGPKATFASNTSVTASRQYPGGTAGKIAGNVFDSLAPRALYDPVASRIFDQPYTPGLVRDKAFIIYQTNLIFSMGALGGPLVVWFVIAAFRGRKNRGGEQNFWLMLIGFSLLTGLAVVGERDFFGLAHLTLLPLELLGITLLAARFCPSRLVAWLIIAGCAFDFSLGVLLHARIQHLENTAQNTYFAGLSYTSGQFQIGAPGPDSLSGSAWINWFGKHQVALCDMWLRDAEAFHRGEAAFQQAKVNLRQAIAEKLRDDDKYWRGWYRHHGGAIEMIGDRFGGGDAASALLALAALGLLCGMALLGKMAPRPDQAVSRVTAAAAVKPRSSRSRHKR
jgi:hypothetical protein